MISDSPRPIKGDVIPESIRRVKGRCGQDDGLIEIALVGHAHRYQVRIERGSGAPHSYEAPGSVLVPAVKRGRGRPAKPIEFYRRVADAARDAEADPDRRSIARSVQARAAQWPDIDGTPPLTTVERWLKQARKHGLYQGPRDKHRTPPRAAAHVQPMNSRLSQPQSRTTTRRPQP